MQITNLHGLPAPFVSIATNDDYDKGPADYSVTELISSPRRRQLMIRHDNEIVVDVARLYYMVRGKLTHKVLEEGDQTNAIHEYRFYITLVLPDGKMVVVSGCVDRLDEHWGEYRIIDWKETSVFSFLLGEKEEWVAQGNMYIYGMGQEGFLIPYAEINALLRDHMERRAEFDADYPADPVVKVPIPIWPTTKTLDYMLERCRLHEAAKDVPDDDLPFCTDAEMWAKPVSYAVIRHGRPKADRVLPSKDEAYEWLARKFGVKREYLQVVAGKKYRIEERPSERVRCARFCLAAPFCNQHQEYLKEAE